MNWFDDRVRLIAKAAHRDDEERRFLVPRERRMVGGSTRFVGSEPQAETSMDSGRCERLDVGLEDVPYIDLVKIDVEDGEAAVLDGASGLLDEGQDRGDAGIPTERASRGAPGGDGEAADVAGPGPRRHPPRTRRLAPSRSTRC